MPGSFFGSGAVTSVAGRSGVVVLTKSDVGLSALTNAAQVLRTEMGAASGVATLDSSGKLEPAQIPAIAVSTFLGVVGSQAAMLALTGANGSWVSRSDSGTIFVLNAQPASTLGNWTELSYPTAPVLSVSGKTGSVSLVFSDLGGNVATSQFNGGTAATSATFWRGDGTWATPQSDIAAASLWTTKGDMAVATSNSAATRLAVGANGTVLLSDSTATSGVKWGPLPISSIANYATSTLALTDPNADRIAFWDDSAGHFDWLTPGGFLEVTGTTFAPRTAAHRGISKDVYIAIRTDGLDGTGTPEDPYDGSTAALFDAVMADVTKTPAYTSIHLKGSGTFQSKGFLPRTGWKFYAGSATLQIPVLTSGEASTFIAIFGGTIAPLVSDILIDGGIWDLNMQNQTQAMSPAAIQLICDGLTVQNMKVINFGNTLTAEEFVIGNFSNGSRDGIIHRKPVRYRNIEFTGLASGVTNLGTITLLNSNGGQNVTTNATLSAGWFEDVEVSGIHAHDIATSDDVSIDVVNIGGWVKNFRGHDNTFKNITGQNARYGYYCDTGSLQNISIRGDVITNVSQAVFIGPQTSGSVADNITISRGMFAANSYIPIEVDGTHCTVRSVTIDDNQMTAHSGTNIFAHGVANVKIRRNTIDSSSSEIVTTSSTVAERYGNCRLDGVPVTGDTNIAGTSTANAFSGLNVFSALNTFRSAKQTDESGFGYQVNLADTTAYSASPKVGLRFEAKIDSSAGTAGIAGLHAYKVNTTDGDFSGRMGFATAWFGHSGATERMTLFEDGGLGLGAGTTSAGVGNVKIGGGSWLTSAASTQMYVNTTDIVMRGLRTTGWLDGVTGTLFQIGPSTDKVTFQTQNGNIASRMQFSSVVSQFTAGSYLDTPVPISGNLVEYIDASGTLVGRVSATGNLLLGGLTASQFIETDSNKVLVSKTAAQMRTDLAVGHLVAVPSTASSTGTVGDWAFDGTFIYVCPTTNTWFRAAVATWP